MIVKVSTVSQENYTKGNNSINIKEIFMIVKLITASERRSLLFCILIPDVSFEIMYLFYFYWTPQKKYIMKHNYENTEKKCIANALYNVHCRFSYCYLHIFHGYGIIDCT